ncbi:MAG: ATP-binding cassette domain-containing protein [Cytophagaceae bacterium]|nr:ATP-binding cassette domain-containing protein [Cytophagaceae bacterium]MDW8455647.1 ATP-binding cassette domain-containing protein [Cytophagaceae bacterium]
MSGQFRIQTEHLGKKFGHHWIFKNLNIEFKTGEHTAIIGPNGSGKSTLLQIIARTEAATIGNISYMLNNTSIPTEHLYKYISIAAPYIDLIEEFTLSECVKFHFKFKKSRAGISFAEFISDVLDMKKDSAKTIKFFSSGMKQKLKLALALYSDTPVLLLDEPTTNLDQNNIQWYRDEIEKCANNKLIIVCSNIPHEYFFCSHIVNL